MGDLDDAAGLLDEAGTYLSPSDITAQAAAIEMVIARFFRISSTNEVIMTEINALTKLQKELEDAGAALHYRKTRLGVIANNLRKGSAS